MATDRIVSLADHERLVQALLTGAALPGPPGERRCVQTHISSLLLAGDQVLKLRKPLRLPFLDFSSAELRRIDCEEELRLNRRTAPMLYERVVAIGGTPDDPKLDAPAAEAFDWALRMRRFDERELLDRLAHDGRLDAATVDALAREVSDFHHALPPSPPRFGAPADVRRWALDNLDALDASPLLAPDAPRLRALRGWTEAQFIRHRELLEARHAGGWVREGHGDLHLGNIVRLQGVPRLFDGLEFNAALRHTDIVCDMAFTFMDLLRHGVPGLAWRFASAWAERGGDYSGLVLLPFFAVYRALVRAKVALLRAGQADREALDAVHRDLALAERIARLHEAPRPPWLILTSGVSGSGKSTVATLLVEELGALRLRSDVERKRLHGLAPDRHPDAAQRAWLYAPEATRRTFDHLRGLAEQLLGAGLGVIVDGAFLRRAERERFAAAARACGANCRIVECVAPLDVLRSRLAGRQTDGRDPSDADEPVLALQLGIREPIGADEPRDRVDTDIDLPALRARCAGLVACWRGMDAPAGG